MLDTMTVAAVQMNALGGDLQHNLSDHRRLAQEAVEAGANLVVFPELSTTAHYGEESVVDLAEEIGEGIVYDAILAPVAGLKCSIGYGVCAEDNTVFAVFCNQVGYNGRSTPPAGAETRRYEHEDLQSTGTLSECDLRCLCVTASHDINIDGHRSLQFIHINPFLSRVSLVDAAGAEDDAGESDLSQDAGVGCVSDACRVVRMSATAQDRPD